MFSLTEAKTLTMNTFSKLTAALAVISALAIQWGCQKTQVGPTTFTTPTNPRPPVTPYFKANAGPDLNISIPKNDVVLDGSASEDTGRVVTKYVWEKIFSAGVNAEVGKLLRQEVFGLEEGVHVFRLVATDRQGTVSADTMQVTVTDNFAVGTIPVIESICDTIFGFEGEAAHEVTVSTYVDSADVRYYFNKGFAIRQVSGPSPAILSTQQYAMTNFVTIQNVTRGDYVFRVDAERKGAKASGNIVLSLYPDTVRGKEYFFESTWIATADSLSPSSLVYVEIPCKTLLPGRSGRTLSVAFSDDGINWTEVDTDDFFSPVYWGVDQCNRNVFINRSVNGNVSFANKKVRVRIKVLN